MFKDTDKLRIQIIIFSISLSICSKKSTFVTSS